MSAIVVFDGDDTLWFVEALYDAAREDAGRIVAKSGLDATAWDVLERVIDVENVATLGFSTTRFPTSCVEAYERLARYSEVPIDSAVRERIRIAASRVFEWPAPVVEDAESVLSEMSHSHRLALLTRGDPLVQNKRLAESGLEPFFERVEIVSEKNGAVFRHLLDAMGARPDQSWSIGNSLTSDINPALESGMSAIWVEAHVWEYERREAAPSSPRLFVADSLRGAADLLLHKAT